jgi:hypothetical protein
VLEGAGRIGSGENDISLVDQPQTRPKCIIEDEDDDRDYTGTLGLDQGTAQAAVISGPFHVLTAWTSLS